jgi:glutathione S-transferase
MSLDEHLSPAMRALNPAGKVPFLVDGGMVITESCAIQLYLAEKHPEAGFMPDDLALRGQVYRWMFFLATDIEQPLWRIALHEFIYPVAERVPADAPLAMRDGKAMIAVLEGHMKDRRYLVGDRLTVADFNAAYTLDWARWAGMLQEAPRLQAFVNEMYARPKAPSTIAAAFVALGGETERAGSV